MRYQIAYLWFVSLSVLNLWFSTLILKDSYGRELNPIADLIYQRFHVSGLVVFKLTTVLFIIVLCEVIGTRRDDLGRRVALLAVVLSVIPVLMGMYWVVKL